MKSDSFRPTDSTLSFHLSRQRVKRPNAPVEHSKKPLPSTGLQLFQVPSWFPIFTSNMGIRLLCETFFASIEGRDQRMTTMVTLLQFEYVTTLAFIYKVICVNRDNGNPGPFAEVSDLRNAVTGLNLPAPILKYLEAIGIVEMSNGVKIGPYFRNDMMDSPLYLSPLSILQEADRAIPPGHWSIDHDWIRGWNQHTTRLSRRSLGFGVLDYKVHEGSPLLCVLKRQLHDPVAEFGLIQALSPIQMADDEAKLGACYSWRDYDQLADWPGSYHHCLYPALRGSEFNAVDYFERVATSYITHDD